MIVNFNVINITLTTMSQDKNKGVRICYGVIVCTWDDLQDKEFALHNQVQLVIYPIRAVCPLAIKDSLHTIQFDWIQDEEKFSGIVLKHQCHTTLELVQRYALKNKNTAICQEKIGSNSAMICCFLLMTKLKWTLLKALRHMSSKIPDLNFSADETKYLLIYDRTLNNISQRQSQFHKNEEQQISQSKELFSEEPHRKVSVESDKQPNKYFRSRLTGQRYRTKSVLENFVSHDNKVHRNSPPYNQYQHGKEPPQKRSTQSKPIRISVSPLSKITTRKKVQTQKSDYAQLKQAVQFEQVQKIDKNKKSKHRQRIKPFVNNNYNPRDILVAYTKINKRNLTQNAIQYRLRPLEGGLHTKIQNLRLLNELSH